MASSRRPTSTSASSPGPASTDTDRDQSLARPTDRAIPAHIGRAARTDSTRRRDTPTRPGSIRATSGQRRSTHADHKTVGDVHCGPPSNQVALRRDRHSGKATATTRPATARRADSGDTGIAATGLQRQNGYGGKTGTATRHSQPQGARNGETGGSGPDGSRPDGSRPDGSRPDGSSTAGSGPDGSSTAGSGPDGSSTAGSGPDGSSAAGSSAPHEHREAPKQPTA